MIKSNRFITSDRIHVIELLFKIIYIIHLLACFNSLLRTSFVTTITLIATMAFGGLLLICRVFSIKQYFRTPALLLLVLFVVSFAIPSFLIYRYAFFDSIKSMVWMTFHYGLLYAFDSKKDPAGTKKELNIVAVAITLFITLENLVSILMAYAGYFKAYPGPDGLPIILGISWWGRLYGVHSDPNYACVYSTAAIMIAVYFFFKYANKSLRVISGVSAFINFVYISFSASRSGLICLVIAAAIFSVSYCIGQFKAQRFCVLKSVAVALLVCASVFVLNKGVIAGYNAMNTLLNEPPASSSTDQTENTTDPENMDATIDTTVPEPTEPNYDSTTIGRTDEELQGDITNRRGDIWGSAIEIFSKNAIFGIGFENVLGYAHDKMPDTYIVNNDQAEFDAFHNTVMDVLVSQGIVGIFIAGVFAILFLIYCIKGMRSRFDMHRHEICLALSICISTLTSAMLLSHIFYINIATTGIFWLFAGYLSHFLYAPKDELPN